LLFEPQSGTQTTLFRNNFWWMFFPLAGFEMTDVETKDRGNEYKDVLSSSLSMNFRMKWKGFNVWFKCRKTFLYYIYIYIYIHALSCFMYNVHLSKTNIGAILLCYAHGLRALFTCILGKKLRLIQICTVKTWFSFVMQKCFQDLSSSLCQSFPKIWSNHLLNIIWSLCTTRAEYFGSRERETMFMLLLFPNTN
jgi:hypothetical protein